MNQNDDIAAQVPVLKQQQYNNYTDTPVGKDVIIIVYLWRLNPDPFNVA